MRKFISLVVALIFGVSAGLGSSNLWLRARVVPYCTVAKNADAYHMKFIRVKAKVHFGNGDLSIFEHCDPDEALASAIEFEDGDGADFSLHHPTRLQTADAIVEGEFDGQYSLGCYGPKFRIIASKVELTSPIQDFVPED